MLTVFGEIPEENLEKAVVREEIPCGQSVTTRYFYNGKLARQDCEILILRGLPSESLTGEI